MREKLLFEQSVIDGGSEGGRELRAFLRNLDKGSRTLTPKGVARMGDASQAYVIYSQVSSDSAHPTISSLSRYILEHHAGEINELNIPPAIEEDEIFETISFICSALLGACYATGEVLGKTLAAADVRRGCTILWNFKGCQIAPPTLIGEAGIDVGRRGCVADDGARCAARLQRAARLLGDQ